MKTPSKILVLVLLVLLACGCSRKSAPASASQAEAPPVALTVAGGGGRDAAEPAAAERSRIVTMDMTITVDRFDDALAELRASVARSGGYVSDMHASGAKGEESARLELRVPADRAGAVRGSLAALGEVTNATEKVEDVTEQRADLEARLASARVQEKRLLEIMATKSGSIADLVETERELARVRENVERLEAQQRSLKGKIDLATLHVTLEQRGVAAWRTPGTSLYRAGRAGVDGAAAIAVYGGMAVLAVAPSFVPIAAVAFAVVMLVRRRRASQLAALAG